MQWDDLRIFLAVARHGLIARAAADLNSDPTTVSRRVQRLEKDLGETLIERRRTGAFLTAAGHRIAERAQAMEEASAALIAGSGGRSLLRISTTEGFGSWFVARHLAGFTAANPGIQIELVATSGFLSPSRRETDIAILLAKPRRGPLVTRKLTDYSLKLYGRRGQGDGIASPGDLASRTLVGYIPDLIYAPELDYLDEIGPALSADIRSSSITAQHRLIAAGAGIGVLPRFIGDLDPTIDIILPMVTVHRSFWLSIHRDVRDRPQVRQFVDWLVGLTRAHHAALVG